MAKRISQLTTAGTLQADDVLSVVQSGTTKKVAISALKTDLGVTAHLANADIHNELDDTSSAADKLWSASKITAQLALKSDTTHTHDLAGATVINQLPYNKGGTGLSTISAKKLIGAQSANTIIEVGMGTGLDMSGGNVIVTPDTTVQQVKVGKNGSLVSTRWRLNFIEGTNIGLTIADDAGNNETDITVNLSHPLTTNGDILIRAAGALDRLGIGSDGQVLTVASGAPTWASASAGKLDLLADTGTIAPGTTGITYNTSAHFLNTYSSLILKVLDLQPTTDARNLHLVGYTDGGTTPLGSYDYVNNGRNSADASKTLSAAAASQIILHTSDTIGNQTNEGLTGTIEAFGLWSAQHKTIHWQTSHKNTSTVLQSQNGSACILTTTAVNALRLLFSSSSTMAGGRVWLYGLRAA